MAGTTAIFVVASTFAFAVIQRRREIALLRAVGATPRQVRKMVRSEALLVGVLASAVGTALGLLGARLLADMLIEMGISPPGSRSNPRCTGPCWRHSPAPSCSASWWRSAGRSPPHGGPGTSLPSRRCAKRRSTTPV
ncbi:ABC transporter permease [Streptosporangium lutulentum]